MQGSQFLPLEAFAVVTVPFGLGVPCSVGRTRVPLRLPHPPGTSQVSFEQELMDHGSWFMALGNASALLKSPKTIYWFFALLPFPLLHFPINYLELLIFRYFSSLKFHIILANIILGIEVKGIPNSFLAKGKLAQEIKLC